MSVSVYHYFQLTEFSTIFLHLNWMFSKAQVPYRWVQSMSNLLIVTFAQRVAVSAFIVMHTALKLHELKLWQVRFVHYCTGLHGMYFALSDVSIIYMAC
jgi:hypothetical protein